MIRLSYLYWDEEDYYHLTFDDDQIDEAQKEFDKKLPNCLEIKLEKVEIIKRASDGIILK